MTVITCVDDLRNIARKRTPRMFFDYCESGSWSESTLHANEALRARLAELERLVDRAHEDEAGQEGQWQAELLPRDGRRRKVRRRQVWLGRRRRG